MSFKNSYKIGSANNTVTSENDVKGGAASSITSSISNSGLSTKIRILPSSTRSSILIQKKIKKHLLFLIKIRFIVIKFPLNMRVNGQNL